MLKKSISMGVFALATATLSVPLDPHTPSAKQLMQLCVQPAAKRSTGIGPRHGSRAGVRIRGVLCSSGNSIHSSIPNYTERLNTRQIPFFDP